MGRVIEGASKVEVVMGRWTPTDLAFVERLEFGRGSDSATAIKLVGMFQRRDVWRWPDVDKPMHRVTMLFDGVAGLNLKDFGSAPTQIMGFDIHAIGDRGWEGVHFEIQDYEDGRIRFFCDRVRIIAVEAEVDAWRD